MANPASDPIVCRNRGADIVHPPFIVSVTVSDPPKPFARTFGSAFSSFVSVFWKRLDPSRENAHAAHPTAPRSILIA
jgi:hypothetical protein